MNAEVTTRKTNIDDLWHCLHSLLKRVEQLEDTANPHTEHSYFTGGTPERMSGVVDELLSVSDTKHPDVKVNCSHQNQFKYHFNFPPSFISLQNCCIRMCR